VKGESRSKESVGDGREGEEEEEEEEVGSQRSIDLKADRRRERVQLVPQGRGVYKKMKVEVGVGRLG